MCTWQGGRGKFGRGASFRIGEEPLLGKCLNARAGKLGQASGEPLVKASFAYARFDGEGDGLEFVRFLSHTTPARGKDHKRGRRGHGLCGDSRAQVI